MRVMLNTLHFGDVLPGSYHSIVSLPWVVMIRNSGPLEAGGAFQVVTKCLGIFVTVYDNKPGRRETFPLEAGLFDAGDMCVYRRDMFRKIDTSKSRKNKRIY